MTNPTSNACYRWKRDEGKKHNDVLVCLSRRHCDVLFAMLRTKSHDRVR